jgi:hypothetical protein
MIKEAIRRWLGLDHHTGYCRASDQLNTIWAPLIQDVRGTGLRHDLELGRLERRIAALENARYKDIP